MNKAIYKKLFYAFTFASQTVLAASIQCPSEIKTNQNLQQKIHGWDLFIDDPNIFHHFNRITFYSGNPKEHASLAPDSENKGSNQLTWTFGKDPVWLACGYSDTYIQLIQKLPATVKKCTIKYNNAEYSSVLGINCI